MHGVVHSMKSFWFCRQRFYPSTTWQIGIFLARAENSTTITKFFIGVVVVNGFLRPKVHHDDDDACVAHADLVSLLLIRLSEIIPLTLNERKLQRTKLRTARITHLSKKRNAKRFLDALESQSGFVTARNCTKTEGCLLQFL